MLNPLVSVIIPNYCHARYLNERIDSILNQTYQNFEIIILDDKSTDNSKEVIETYRNNPHVSQIVYNDVNGGNTFLQWEKGINLAKGELCYIAESDDFCRPELLERLVRKFEEDDEVVLARCNTFFVNDKGEIYGGIKPKKKDSIYSGYEFIKRFFLAGNGIYNAGMALFSRKAALSIDKRYQSFKGAGDYMFWVEISECGKVANVDEPLNFFRRHEGVVTAKRDSDGSNLTAKREIIDYIFSKVNLTEEEKNFAIYSNLKEARTIQFDSPEIQQRVQSLWYMPEDIYNELFKKGVKKEPFFFRLKKKLAMAVLGMTYHQYAQKYYGLKDLKV